MMKNWTETQIRDALRRIATETRDKGDEVEFRTCPYCGKSDWPFSVNISKQVFACNHLNTCGARGTLFKLLSDQGIISPVTRAIAKEYRRPSPDKGIQSTDDFFAWYNRERGIKPEILKAFNVGFKENGGKKYIVYRYLDERKQEVNRKYRNCQDKKDMWTEKGAEQVYYGADNLNFEGKRLVVVSGEDDVHALAQLGIENVVSVPFGDRAYSPAMDRINARFPEIILLFDADEPGQAGAYEFAKKAGFQKCRNAVLPFKDARDCLLNGLDIFDIEKEIGNAKPFTCKEIISAGETKSAVVESVFKSKSYLGTMLPVKEINAILGGVRLGELSVLIAHTGCGKTPFALNFVWWAVQAGMRALILSFENRVESVITKLIEIKTRKQIRSFDNFGGGWLINQSPEWIEAQIDELAELPIYFLNKSAISETGYLDVEKLLTIVEYAAKFYDVNLVLIDHLHYFLNLSGERNPVYKIDETVRKLSQATQATKLHTLLIVHPPKTTDDRTGGLVTLGLNSPKGASSIQQEAFNFLTVSKKEEDGKFFARLQILKNREIGKTGEVVFSVLDNMNTYLSDSMQAEGKQETWYQK